MKRKFYDMVFAQTPIREFMEDIVIHFSQRKDLSERDRSKVDKIFKFLIDNEMTTNRIAELDILEGKNLVMLCRHCGDDQHIVSNLMKSKAFNKECFDALLQCYEEYFLDELEATDMFGLESLLISCEYMPEDKLRAFSMSKSKYTRASVAVNPSCPRDSYEILVHDKDSMVRKYAAKNTTAPEDALMEMANDKNRYVREAVAGNHGATEDVIRAVFDINDFGICLKVVANPKCPSDILLELASYVNRDMYRTYRIRLKVAQHPNMTNVVYEALKADSNQMYSQIAFVCKECPIEDLYNFNPKNKLAKSIAYHIMEREDLSYEIIKFFLDNMGAKIRAVVIAEGDIPKEYLTKYYRSDSKDVLIEIAKKKQLNDNDALMAILKKYNKSENDFEICSLAAACLGPGSAPKFIEYLKEKPEYWEHHLKTYLGYSQCTEDDIWTVFNEFSSVRENDRFPLAEGMLGAIRCRKNLSTDGIERFIKYASEGKGIYNVSGTMELLVSFDKFYSTALLNMCMSDIRKAYMSKG